MYSLFYTKTKCEEVLLFDVSSIIFWSSQHPNKQHQQTVTVHLPIYWGTTRLPLIRPPELEPSIFKKNWLPLNSFADTCFFGKVSLLSKVDKHRINRISTCVLVFVFFVANLLRSFFVWVGKNPRKITSSCAEGPVL